MEILTTTASVCLDGRASAGILTDLAETFAGTDSSWLSDDASSSNGLENSSFLLHFTPLGSAVWMSG